MADFAKRRLTEERKQWRKDHPPGFYARPKRNEDGSTNLMFWECAIPGKADTLWEGGLFHMTFAFPEDYPSSPPKVQFVPVLFHPNVYPSGTVCLSILNADEDWNPSLTVRHLLLGIQDLLDNPNPDSPAQAEPYKLFTTDLEAYRARVKIEVRNNPPIS
ncbi:Ubiquitin-conjugating enzyme E2 E2 [Hondaea fermentalgiana]|uniref:SUMO-conjugating enzyme UBC9 n=1 Tax=Hondaea fermentalgiana TaxID=2315210 RepID=A0A2R5GBN6_9STRA|nr:Ubiquitin-conjugating enzyme E2 E2 [Hondaea fermentalgiana]|eukprot:GBG28406.1 Ubiquitin-conjugating enzyme E2 E2 [Hondaea fermentalgiana]